MYSQVSKKSKIILTMNQATNDPRDLFFENISSNKTELNF